MIWWSDALPWSDNLEPQSPAYTIAASSNPRIRVVAGPGTGKSFAMKRRVARLLETAVEPHTILPVTFTRVAAEDLHRELVGMGVPGCEDIKGTTLHSLAMRILMRNHVLHATGRTPRPLNEFELKPLEADLADAYGGIRQVRKKIKAFEAGWARLQHQTPGHVQSRDDAAFEAELLSWMGFHEAMLIGEVIPQLYDYLASNPAADERQEYAHILVDEFQDLNRAEQGVVQLLSDAAHVCIVGDDDQSIYSFRHAHPEGIREWLIQHFAADDLTLADCRRCPTRVVEMANRLIANNRNRPVQRALTPVPANGPGDVRIIQYQSLQDEVAGIVEIVANLIGSGTPPGDILILAQRGVIGTPIYEALRVRDIPVRSYYAEAELDAENAQVRFAFLKLFIDRQDKVALRWLVGYGSGTWFARSYARLREHCELNGQTPWDALEQLSAGTLRIQHINALVGQFERIKQEIENLETEALADGLRSVIDRLFPDTDASVRDLRDLAIQTIETFGTQDRTLFLRELTSAIAQPDIPSEIEDVRIMSLHKSKGLSAAVTVVAGCIEGLLPKQPDSSLSAVEQAASLEEQRRLFYVGITRVKATPSLNRPGTLILTYSQQMSFASALKAGIDPAQSSYGNARLLASRFIREMRPAAPDPQRG
jgi:superfamily I DNA/RNA helicase